MVKNGKVATAHGEIAWMEEPADGPTVVFLHGNSSCKEIFGRQFVPPLTGKYRLIAMDLPGHGGSSDAADPDTGYSINGFARAIIAAMEGLGLTDVTIVGWSLGGHVAVEILERWPAAKAIWITGTPPISGTVEDMAAGFLQSEHMALTFKPDFTDEEAALYAQETVGEGVPVEDWMVTACRRADGRFRPVMAATALSGVNADERAAVKNATKPVAVVSGAGEPFVNNAFLTGLDYGNLWDGKVHILEGTGHNPFWEVPEMLNPLLARFLDEVTRA